MNSSIIIYMQGENLKQISYTKLLGEIIKSHRKRTNKSIYLISAESSIAKSSWRELELGLRKDINLSTFCKIAEGINIPPHKLLKELSEKLGKDFSFTDIEI